MFRVIDESRLLVELERITKTWVETSYIPDGFYLVFAELLLDFVEIYVCENNYFGFICSWCDFVDKHDVSRFNLTGLVKYLEKNTFNQYKKFFSSYKSDYLNELRRHRANEARNKKSLERKLSQAIKRYSKSEVVRIDLAYQQGCHDGISIHRFYNEFMVFRNLISKSISPFNSLVDYFWALEQGETKGYHCHLLFVFDGHKRQKGWGVADSIGRCWKDITNNEGCYFNCHDPAQIKKYSELGILGIGRIHRDNNEEVDRMLKTARYLVSPEKESQHLRVKTNLKMRTFQ